MGKIIVKGKEDKNIIINALSSNKSISFSITKKIRNSVTCSSYSDSNKDKATTATGMKYTEDEYMNILERWKYPIKICLIIMYVIMNMIMITTSVRNLSFEYLLNILGIVAINIGIYRINDILVIYFMDKVGRNKDFKNLRRYHGAEHAVINAYYVLGRLPRKDELEDYSCLSYNCGSLEAIKKAYPFIVIGICLIMSSRVIEGLFIIIFFIITKEKTLFVLERLAVTNPTDKECEVAVRGLKKALEELDKFV